MLLALLTPEVHSPAASAFLEEATQTLALSPWSVTEPHSALGLKVRTGALSTAEADRVLEGFERTLTPGLLSLELEAQDFRNANACPRGWSTTLRAGDALQQERPVRAGRRAVGAGGPVVQLKALMDQVVDARSSWFAAASAVIP